jgi:hypothetical protein
MRIYLDSNIFQFLKSDASSELKQLIDEDKKHNIYCYSEAHIFDLLRDKTDNKLSDLEFIGKIVDDNCWHYDKKILFDYIKPIDYFNSIDSNTEFSLDGVFSNEPLLMPFKQVFKSIPLKFSDFISSSPLPVDFPENLKKVLYEPTNLYDFMLLFFNYSSELTAEQKKFKELLTYLRSNDLIIDIYKYIGIEGYENGKLTDKVKFRESLLTHLLKDKKEKYRYDLFLEVYNTLEIYGIVKGKPRKQALPNMIDDGRHSFFGSFCDIVVSMDSDFINKTKFIYDVFDYKISVFNIDEFRQWLELSKQQYISGFKGLLAEFNKDFTTIPEFHREVRDEKLFVLYKLSQTHLSYFNLIGLVFSDKFEYYFFSKEDINQSTGTLIKEIQYVTDVLINDLGNDIYGNGVYVKDEFIEGNWSGRVWLFDNIQINLSFQQKLFLTISHNS